MRYFLERRTILSDLERRPALPDGLPSAAASANSPRRRHHIGHETRGTPSGVEFGIMQSGSIGGSPGFIEKPSDQSGVQEMKIAGNCSAPSMEFEDDELFQA